MISLVDFHEILQACFVALDAGFIFGIPENPTPILKAHFTPRPPILTQALRPKRGGLKKQRGVGGGRAPHIKMGG